MSNNVNNSSKDPVMEMMDNLHASMIKGGSSYDLNLGQEDPDEAIEIKDIQLDEDDIILFKDVQDIDTIYKVTEIISYSELANFIGSIFMNIFADFTSVTLDRVNTTTVFTLHFTFMTDDQFKVVQDESQSKLIRAIASSFNPYENKDSVAENLLGIVNVQNMPNSDVCKYANITKDAKSYLSNILYYSNLNKKHKWIRKENYTIFNEPQRGYNAQTYHTIKSDILIDADKLSKILFCTKDKRNKFKFAYKDLGVNSSQNNHLVEVYRFSIPAENKIRGKYNAEIIH